MPYSCSLASENCPRRPIEISHRAAAFAPRGVVSISLRSAVPAFSRRVRLSLPSLGQNRRTCLASCFLQPHSHAEESTPGTLHIYRKCARPIFSVRSWVRAELSAFARPSWRDLLLDHRSPLCAWLRRSSGILSWYCAYAASQAAFCQSPTRPLALLGILSPLGVCRESQFSSWSVLRAHSSLSSAGVWRTTRLLPRFSLSFLRILAFPSFVTGWLPLSAWFRSTI